MGEIWDLDKHSGQVEVMYQYDGQWHWYWLHLDDEKEVRWVRTSIGMHFFLSFYSIVFIYVMTNIVSKELRQTMIQESKTGMIEISAQTSLGINIVNMIRSIWSIEENKHQN